MAVVEDLNKELFGERAGADIAEMSRPYYGSVRNWLGRTPLLYKPTEEGTLAFSQAQNGIESTGLLAPVGNVYDIRGPRGMRIYRTREQGVEFYSDKDGYIGFVPDGDDEIRDVQGPVRRFISEHKLHIAAGVAAGLLLAPVASQLLTSPAYAQQNQQKVLIDLYNSDGPLAVTVDGLMGDPVSSFGYDLQGKGFVTVRMSGNNETKSGWMRVTTDKGKRMYFPQIAVGGINPNYVSELKLFAEKDDVTGVLTFEAYSNGALMATAGVLPAQLRHTSLMPIDADDTQAAYTASAFANPTDKNADYLITIYDANKQFIADAMFSLPPFGHAAKFPYQLLPGVDIPKKALLQIVGSYDSPYVALNVKQNDLTVVPVTDGSLKVRGPAVSVLDMFANGTLDTAKADKIRTGGKLIYQEVSTNGRRWEFSFTEDGNASLRAVDGTYPPFPVITVTRRIEVPGFVPEEQKVLTFDVPERVELADARYFNPAFVNRVWGTSFGWKGQSFVPLDEKEWNFYVDTRNQVPTRTKDLFKHTVVNYFPQTGFKAGGKPLGSNGIKETNSPPNYPTDYAFILARDDTISSVLLSVALDTTNYRVKSVLVRFPNGASLANIASDLHGIFGEDDNGITTDDLTKFNMSNIDTVLVSGSGLGYPAPLEKFRHRYKLLKPAGTIVETDKVILPDRLR